MGRVKSWEDQHETAWDRFMDSFSLAQLERDLADLGFDDETIEEQLDEAREIMAEHSQFGVGA